MNSGLSFKKNKHCDGPHDRECGDWWTYLAIKSSSGFILAHSGGKRTEATCTHFLDQVFERLPLPMPSTPIVVATDGNSQYREGLAKLYCEPCITYGQVIKQRKENRLVAVIREAVWGKPADEAISTSVIEGYNNKIRQRISRFGRKTATISNRV
jgi:IS1 family transposase